MSSAAKARYAHKGRSQSSMLGFADVYSMPSDGGRAPRDSKSYLAQGGTAIAAFRDIGRGSRSSIFGEMAAAAAFRTKKTQSLLSILSAGNNHSHPEETGSSHSREGRTIWRSNSPVITPGIYRTGSRVSELSERMVASGSQSQREHHHGGSHQHQQHRRASHSKPPSYYHSHSHEMSQQMSHGHQSSKGSRGSQSEKTRGGLEALRGSVVETMEDRGPSLELETDTARAAIAAVIMCDFLCFGWEVDSGFNPIIGLCGLVFAVIYAVEFCLRWWDKYYLLPEAFAKGKIRPLALELLQCFVVVAGVVDIVAYLTSASRLRAALRYVRILRSVRVFLLIDVLGSFMMALINMMRNISWPFCVMALTSFVTAVVVRLYSQVYEIEDADELYPDTMTTMFRLFQVTTMDNWHKCIRGLVDHCWLWGFFFIFFIIFTSWVMISIVTATICDQIMKTTQLQDQAEHDSLERVYRDFSIFLRDCFLEADSDDNGVMDKNEFLDLIALPMVYEKMEELGVQISREELENVFDMLDVDESGELSIDEFTSGLSQMQRNLGIKHVVALNYAIQHLYKKLLKQYMSVHDQRVSRLKELEEKWAELQSRMEASQILGQQLDIVATHIETIQEVNWAEVRQQSVIFTDEEKGV